MGRKSIPAALMRGAHRLQGALPVVNAEMATLAVRMGLALNSTIARR